MCLLFFLGVVCLFIFVCLFVWVLFLVVVFFLFCVFVVVFRGLFVCFCFCFCFCLFRLKKHTQKQQYLSVVSLFMFCWFCSLNSDFVCN